jgi:ABC-2 type transport system permease protein
MGAVSGAFIPQFFLGGFLGAIGKVVPHYWATAAYQGVLVRGHGISGIAQELGILLAFTALFLGVGIWRFRFGVPGAGRRRATVASDGGGGS